MNTFNIVDIETVNWSVNDNFCNLDNHHINCFFIDIELNRAFAGEQLRFLDDFEKKRTERYYFEDDKVRYILSRSVLKVLLSRIYNTRVEDIAIDYSESKPSIKTFPAHFNISHSGNFVFIGISKLKIGVDIEKIQPDFEYIDIINRYFNIREIQSIENSKNPVYQFYKYWTRKEAFLKAIGTGLDFDLSTINISDKEHYSGHTMPDNFIQTGILQGDYYFSISSGTEFKPLFFNAIPGIYY